jgi:hypothetical protein
MLENTNLAIGLGDAFYLGRKITLVPIQPISESRRFIAEKRGRRGLPRPWLSLRKLV